MWHRDPKWENVGGKMMSIDLFKTRLPQNFNLFKKKKAVPVKRSKVKYLSAPLLAETTPLVN